MKKLFVLVFAIALCLGALCVGASASGAEPPQVDGVYQLDSDDDLYWFAELVNGGEYGVNAVLTKDITINENVLDDAGNVNSNSASSFTQWTPIGNSDNRAYTGTFDGGNHTISGLYYSGSGYGGLFGCVGSGGQVKNVNIADSYISNSYSGSSDIAYVGGVCGCNSGTVTNCSVSDSVFSGNNGNPEKGEFAHVGGVCGRNEGGTITNCSNKGSVNSDAYVGGVCGWNEGGTISNCYNTGNVTGTTAGGLCVINYGTIRNCYNTGNVTGTTAGGLCGENTAFKNSVGTITNCYNTGDVTGSGTGVQYLYVGGVCGYNSETITNCYWREDTGLNGCGRDIGTVTNVKSKTAEEFASGEVAWLLNSNQENGPWRQNLSDERDDYPVLDITHEEVVKLTVDEDDVSYLNKGDSFSGVEGIGYYLDGEMVELPYTVEADTVLTAKTLYVVTVDGVVSYVDPNEPVFKLPAAPSRSGYTFVHWSDGTNTYDPGDSVPITGNVTFTAVWQAINIPDPNGITVTQPANGTIRVNPSNGSAGTLITVTATPDEGYELAYITVDGEKITGNTFRMPDKAVTVTAVFVPVTFPFTDVTSGDWFYDAVAYVYANGLMDGTSATTFEPNANMTRAMVWAILARIDGETVTGEAWSTDARAWAMAEGVSDGTDPNGLVTREQFATMLYRYAVAKGYDVSIGESTNILSYADFASISEYAIPAMQWACGSGIVTGVTDSTLAPQGTATRAQCAAMLMRFVEL